MRTLLLLTFALAGCGADASFGSPHITHRGGGCDGFSDGVVVLEWTLRGAAPSAASCQGIDHLEVDLAGSSCDVTIGPVDCVINHWRYDHLPDGEAVVTVTAVDAGGRTAASGAADVILSSTVPSTATPE